MENAHINPTREMDNALSVRCPSDECDCDDCVADRDDPTESPDYVTHEDRFDPIEPNAHVAEPFRSTLNSLIDLNEGFYSSRPWEIGPKPTEK